jgi:zinc transport system permease protein
VFDWLTDFVDVQVANFTHLTIWPERSLPTYEFAVFAVLAIVLVCLICGAMGALVVGNRMAFFSDALAHCAFAGVALGLVASLLAGTDPANFRQQLTLIMVGFGIVVGLLIALVRERTSLASDTVIGVFYAAAVGLGAMCTSMVAGQRGVFSIEAFIFGDPTVAKSWHILSLAALTAGIVVFLWFFYNSLVLTSTSQSLAKSRRVPVRLCQYLFVVLLGVMVNLSLQIVGALLINGLLIVPAATAANLARNLRQMFWYSIGLTLLSGLGGFFLSWEIYTRFPNHPVGTAGTIVVLAVVFFVVSMVIGPRLRDRPR